jgi:hypothetical protein
MGQRRHSNTTFQHVHLILLYTVQAARRTGSKGEKTSKAQTFTRLVMFQVRLFRFGSDPGNSSNFRVHSGSDSGNRTWNPKYVRGSSG